jgi:hypothetical protein
MVKVKEIKEVLGMNKYHVALDGVHGGNGSSNGIYDCRSFSYSYLRSSDIVS